MQRLPSDTQCPEGHFLLPCAAKLFGPEFVGVVEDGVPKPPSEATKRCRPLIGVACSVFMLISCRLALAHGAQVRLRTGGDSG